LFLFLQGFAHCGEYRRKCIVEGDGMSMTLTGDDDDADDDDAGNDNDGKNEERQQTEREAYDDSGGLSDDDDDGDDDGADELIGYVGGRMRRGATRRISPSAALLKATLIAAAVDIDADPVVKATFPSTGGAKGVHWRRYLQGHGRIQLDRVLRFTGDRHSLFVVDIPHRRGLINARR
jgi:hypothetical protein